MRRAGGWICIPATRGVVSPSHGRGAGIGERVKMVAEADGGSCDQGGGIAFRRFTLSRRESLCFPRRFLRHPSPGSRRERALSMASLEFPDVCRA
jgi:hypothetical protein